MAWDTAARNIWPVAFANKEQAEIFQQMVCSLEVGKVHFHSAHQVYEVLMMMAVDGSLRNVRPLLRQYELMQRGWFDSLPWIFRGLIAKAAF